MYPRLYRFVEITRKSGDSWADLEGDNTPGFLLFTKDNFTPLLKRTLPQWGLEFTSIDNRFDESAVSLITQTRFSLSNLERLYDRLVEANAERGKTMDWVGRSVKIYYGSGDVPGLKWNGTTWTNYLGQTASYPAPDPSYPADEDRIDLVFTGEIESISSDRSRIEFKCVSVAKRLDQPIGTLAGRSNGANKDEIIPIVYGDMNDSRAFVPIVQDDKGLPFASVLVETRPTTTTPTLVVFDSGLSNDYKVVSSLAYDGSGGITITSGAPIVATAATGGGRNDTIVPFGTATLGNVWRNMSSGEVVAGVMPDGGQYFQPRYNVYDGAAPYPPRWTTGDNARVARAWNSSTPQAVSVGNEFYPAGQDLRQFKLDLEFIAPISKIYCNDPAFNGVNNRIPGGGDFNFNGAFGDVAATAERLSTDALTAYTDLKQEVQDTATGTAYRRDELAVFSVNAETWDQLNIYTTSPGLSSFVTARSGVVDEWYVHGRAVYPAFVCEFAIPQIDGDISYIGLRSDIARLGWINTGTAEEEYRGPLPKWNLDIDSVSYDASALDAGEASIVSDGTYTYHLYEKIPTLDALRNQIVSLAFAGSDPDARGRGGIMVSDTVGGIRVWSEVATQCKIRRLYLKGRATVTLTQRDIFARLIGRYDGTKLITPVQVLQDLLTNEVGYTGALVDLTGGARDVWQIDTAITGKRRSYRDILKQVCMECCIVAYTSKSGQEVVSVADVTDTPTGTITQDELSQSGNTASWEYTETPASEIYTRYEVAYARDAARDQMTKLMWVDGNGWSDGFPQAVGGLNIAAALRIACQRAAKLTNADNIYQASLEMVRKDSVAARHIQWHINRKTVRRAMVKITAPIDKLLAYDLNSVITLNIPSLGAYNNASFRVVGYSISGTRVTMDMESL
jgi:hypothetical protein